MFTVLYLLATKDKAYDTTSFFLFVGSCGALAILPFTLTLFIWSLSIIYNGYINTLPEHPNYSSTSTQSVDLEHNIEASKNTKHLFQNGNQTNYPTERVLKTSYYEESLQTMNKRKIQKLNWKINIISFVSFFILAAAVEICKNFV